MKTMTILIFSLLAGLTFGLANPASAQIEIDIPTEDIMQHVTSYRFVSRGLSASKAGNTGLAHDSFVRAARDANKVAQFKLGIMYLEGYRGPSNPERAWAWMELSAEREYPQFREVADLLLSTFSENEKATAQRILEEELRPIYGDEVTIPRVTSKMRRVYRNQTGTRAGFGGNKIRIVDNSSLRGAASQTAGAGSFLDSVTFTDGSVFYARHKWDFEHIVAVETALFRAMGTVTIRDEVDDD